MNKLKTYLNEFLKDEEGMETLQVAAGVVVSVFLIGAVFKLGQTIKGHIDESTEKVNEGFNSLLNETGGSK